MTTASNKAELVQIIRDWITTDTEIRAMNKDLRARKEKLKKFQTI